MTLIQAWKDSLNLCKPSALKLMFLVTLNAMKEVMRVLCVPWFLIIVGIIGLSAFLLYSTGLGSLMYTFIAMSMLLASRPSIHIKDGKYFKEYFLKYLKFYVILALYVVVFGVIGMGLLYILNWFGLTYYNCNPLMYLALLFGMAICIIFIFFGIIEYTVFFYLDNVGSVWGSFKRALRLILYNIPMLIIYLGIAFCIKVAYWLIINTAIGSWYEVSCPLCVNWSNMIMGVNYSLLSLPIYLFSVCLFVNIYTKRIHDQYSLYQ